MSNKVVIGYFPKEICYISSIKREIGVGCEWDMDHGANANNKTEEVVPAFPVDNNDEKSLLTANNWAVSDIRMQCRQETDKNKHPLPTKEIIDNNSITGIRLLSIEQRGNGGRAYKALVNNYLVDVREDVVMDTMLQEGIEAGGILKGEFVWAKCGAQMKLVRKGSELYKLIAEFESKKDKKPVSKKTLEVGGIYRTKKKESYIYIGNIDSVSFSLPDIKVAPYWDSTASQKYENDNSCLAFTKKSVKNRMLFYKLYNSETLEEGIKLLLNPNSYYRFDVKQSHTLIEKIDQVDLDENIINNLSICFAKIVKERILEYTGHVKQKKYVKLSLRNLANFICYNSIYLNMYESKGQEKPLFDVQKYLLFS